MIGLIDGQGLLLAMNPSWRGKYVASPLYRAAGLQDCQVPEISSLQQRSKI